MRWLGGFQVPCTRSNRPGSSESKESKRAKWVGSRAAGIRGKVGNWTERHERRESWEFQPTLALWLLTKTPELLIKVGCWSRNHGRPWPPPQIRTCGTTASGSRLRF